MFRWLLLPLLLLLVTPFASAQSEEEVKFNQKQAKALNSYAESAMKEGFPKVAKRIWLMILSEYDPDQEGAREGLGYERIGNSWSEKPGFVFPNEDNPDVKAANKVRKKWESVAKSVAKAHKSMAEKYDKAGRTDMSQRHYKKVLFYTPDDEEAQEALNHKAIGGTTGTGLEQILYDRSKKIEKIVAEESQTSYPVEKLEEDKHPFLEAAKVDYITVKSANFTVRGDFDEELLMRTAEYAERAAKVMAVVCEGYTGFATEPRFWVTDIAFFQSRATYRQIVSANPEQWENPKSLQFVLENTAGTNLRKNGRILGVQSPNNAQGVFDGMVRSVAQDYSALRTPGLREGIGHAITGMMFNNNRQFIVDREEQQRSSVGEEDDVDAFSPNMDTWKDLALEAAWKLADGTKAAELPLISAAEFPDDARIKSWSFCDYIVRRDPTLLRSLDSMFDKRHPIEVEKAFTAANNGLSVAELEKEWKDFWTEATPVLKNIRNNTPPLETVSKDVKKWLEGFNKARKELASTSVTWNASYSGRCRDHAEYLILNEETRGAVAEQMQNPDLEGATHLGNLFANMACVDTDAKKPRDTFKRWLDYPGYRDALLNPQLLAVGMYVDEGVLVMDVIRGIGKANGNLKAYPASTSQSAPTKVQLADLGPEVQALFEENGHGGKTEVGYPLSLHNFGIGGLVGDRTTYNCQVTYQGEAIQGLLHIADGGSNRRNAAPGMVVFYPLEPLAKGREYTVVWTFDSKDSTSRTEVKFNT